MDDKEYAYLKGKIQHLTDIKMDAYKSQQMRRRLDGLISRSPAENTIQYCKLLERDAQELQKLRDFLTINVTEFFRDSEQFQILRNQILPSMVDEKKTLKIWSAGCSLGAEPYTVSILLEDLAPGRVDRIVATDLDGTILAKARTGGPYAPNEVKQLPKSLLSKYLLKSEDGYRISENIKRKVQFRQHDLLDGPVEEGFDLIICRNVVIYFSDEAKRKLNQGFSRALNPNGVLFIGSTEALLDAQLLGLKRLNSCFYQKPGGEAKRTIPKARRKFNTDFKEAA